MVRKAFILFVIDMTKCRFVRNVNVNSRKKRVKPHRNGLNLFVVFGPSLNDVIS